jgi:polyisoprenoid-binding protein YceI
MRQLLLVVVALAAFTSSAIAVDYQIDEAHSQIGFKTKHIAGKVPGRFTKFSGTFSHDPKNPASWKAEATIDPASINTDNEKRDGHLKSPDFFDVARCPAMTFKSTKVTDVSGDKAKLQGDLTMHCVTKPITLDLEVNGVDKDPWGNVSASFTASATINRKDWDINWNKALDSGGLLVGEKIDITLEISGSPKKADAPAAAKKEEASAKKADAPAAKK